MSTTRNGPKTKQTTIRKQREPEACSICTCAEDPDTSFWALVFKRGPSLCGDLLSGLSDVRRSGRLWKAHLGAQVSRQDECHALKYQSYMWNCSQPTCQQMLGSLLTTPTLEPRHLVSTNIYHCVPDHLLGDDPSRVPKARPIPQPCSLPPPTLFKHLLLIFIITL